MAEPGLITGQPHGRLELVDHYRDALRRLLAWRRDRDDVVDEATDHLYLATEELIREGVRPDVAQRQVLERFGDVRSVAIAHATTRAGVVAMPSRFTQYAGALGLAVAGTWIIWGLFMLVIGAALLIDPAGMRQPADAGAYPGVTMVDFALLPATCIALVGLLRRAGAGWHDPGIAFAAVVVVTGPLAAVAVWHYFRQLDDPTIAGESGYGWVPWLLMLTVWPIAVVAVVRLRALGARHVRADLILLFAWPVVMLLRQVSIWIGPDQTQYGIPCPGQAVMVLGGGAIIFGLGLIGRSHWMSNEQSDHAPGGLDLRWALPGVAGIVVGSVAAAQVVGYLAAEAAGFSGFLFVDHAGPAFTSAATAALAFALGLAALRRTRRQADTTDSPA